MPSDKQKADAPLSAENEIVVAFSKYLSNLYHEIGKRDYMVGKLSIVNDGRGGFTALITSRDHSDRPVVAFGNGKTVIGALFGLNAAISAQKWREDRYRTNRGGGNRNHAKRS